MAKEGACAVDLNTHKLSNVVHARCKVFYTFMVGMDNTTQSAAEVATESAAHHDMVVLDQAVDPGPNERGGNQLLTPKVRRMFGFAQHHFPWATHYAKCDIDAHPLLNTALRRIARADEEAAVQIAAGAVSEDWSEANGGVYYGDNQRLILQVPPPAAHVIAATPNG